MDTQRYISLIQGEFGEKFALFAELLTEYNEKFNLTSVLDEKGIFYKHFLDSVLPESLFSEGARVAEIGSGGGFPSIPLKIIRKDLSFSLIESTGKKCVFLRTCVDKLGLDCVEVINSRAEELSVDKNYREKFDICCARAVARLNTLCEYCLPFVKTGGKFIAYKGEAGEEISECGNALKILGGEIERAVEYELPEGYGKRTAVVIRKIKSTPEKYPRGRGLERKRPL